ncbi:MAG TPA: hypothetical protein VH482_00490 [Thermomicrobiales bacterium]|jgi:hypothetical protein
MSGHRPFAELAAKMDADPEQRALVAEYERAMRDALALADVRATLGTNRQAVDDSSNGRTEVRCIQHDEDTYLSTLRDYVEDLGGELELIAVFPEGRVRLTAKRG